MLRKKCIFFWEARERPQRPLKTLKQQRTLNKITATKHTIHWRITSVRWVINLTVNVIFIHTLTLTYTSRHILYTSRHILYTSRHLLYTSRPILSTSRHILSTGRHILFTRRHILYTILYSDKLTLRINYISLVVILMKQWYSISCLCHALPCF